MQKGCFLDAGCGQGLGISVPQFLPLHLQSRVGLQGLTHPSLLTLNSLFGGHHALSVALKGSDLSKVILHYL